MGIFIDELLISAPTVQQVITEGNAVITGNFTIDEAKKWIKQRELENERKWKDLYGDHDFWNPQHYDLIIDTYATGQMETVGRVLDKLGK